MKLVGITGGIGMGKSTCSEMLVAAGHVVVDTDHLAREVVDSDEDIRVGIRKRFGSPVFDADGRLNRSKLAGVVFNSPDERKALEELVHPAIRARWVAETDAWRSEGHPLGFVVIPLLYETSAEGMFDVVICIACSAATQNVRLSKRGWTESEIRQRNDAQMDVKTKMLRSQYVIWTEGQMASTEQQMKMVLPRMGA